MKRRFVCALLAAALLCALLVFPANAASGTSISDAVSITLGKTYSRSITSSNDSSNYYVKFTVSKAGYLCFHTNAYTHSGTRIDFAFVLFDSKGNLISNVTADKENSIDNSDSYLAVKAGTYYANILSTIAVYSGSFSLEYNISFTASSNKFESEPNDDAAHATLLTDKTKTFAFANSTASTANNIKSYTGEVDYFKVYAEQACTASLTISNGMRLQKGTTFEFYFGPTNKISKYDISGWAHNDDSCWGTVSLQSGWNYFLMHTEGVTSIYAMTVSGISTSCPTAGYKDVPSYTNWAHEGIDFMVARGFMGSTSTSKKVFEPDTACTRSMIVSILYRLAGSPAVSYSSVFPDVASNAWYANAVIWAYNNKVVSGYSSGLFGPNDKVTREQMAVILLAYTKNILRRDYYLRADLSSFPDANKVTWSKDAMQWAVRYYIISGKATGGKTYLAPQGNATRAEVASIMMRFINLIS